MKIRSIEQTTDDKKKISKTIHLQNLPSKVRQNILSNIKFDIIDGNLEEEKELILNSRLCDIEDICDIDKYLI